MAYGTRKGKRKKIKKVNHINRNDIKEKLDELRGQESSKYYQHILARDRAWTAW